jgi:hypothetical protein
VTRNPARAVVLLLAFLLTTLLAPLSAHACTGTVTVTPSAPGEQLPPTGPAPGTALTVTGTEFVAGPVVVHWGSSKGPVLGKAVADRRGEFSLEVVVPEQTGERQRVVAESANASDSGMPSVGWADLAVAAPATTGGAAVTEQPAPVSDRGPGAIPVPALVLLVLLSAAAVLAGVVVRSRRRARAAQLTGLDRELVELLETDPARDDAPAPR